MSVINTNVKSLVAQNAMNVNSRFQDTAMQQLSTGLRINSSSDDAAGMAIASRMTSQIKGLDQAVRNANDGISMLQTADAALSTISTMMQRQHELSVQYANGTYDQDNDKAALAAEFNDLSSEIIRIAEGSKWAGQDLFTDDPRVIQVSDDPAESEFNQIALNSEGETTGTGTAAVTTGAVSTMSVPAGLDELDIEDGEGLSEVMQNINTQRAAIGSTVNRLTFAADNAASISQNMSASRSRIQDTDYAKASSELARTQIIAQASTAMLAQANQSSQGVLALLK